MRLPQTIPGAALAISCLIPVLSRAAAILSLGALRDVNRFEPAKDPSPDPVVIQSKLNPFDSESEMGKKGLESEQERDTRSPRRLREWSEADASFVPLTAPLNLFPLNPRAPRRLLSPDAVPRRSQRPRTPPLGNVDCLFAFLDPMEEQQRSSDGLLLDEIVEAVIARYRGWRTSYGGAVGTRSPRLRPPLLRLEGSDGRCCVRRSRCCEPLEGSVDHCSVCHQGGCAFGGCLTRMQWLAVPSPTDAQLKMITGCGHCGAGDYGCVEGARRQRATMMAEEKDDSAGLSRDGAGAAMAEGDGNVGAPQAEDGGDVGTRQAEGGGNGKGGSRQRFAGRGQRRLQKREKARYIGRQRVVATAQGGDGSDDGKGGVRLRWTEEKGREDGSAGGSASEGCAAVAVTVAAVLLVSPTKVVSSCGMPLAAGLHEVAARSRRRSCSRDWLWNRSGNTKDRCSDTR
ncbi:hypothetical protein B296_00050500 [Ensete ventricosum]|uniref:Uncharacterized protein n=1 Tax=Ensete ventricosum TaxID=4639 RepID=A0A426X8Y7_ENSVE|nr:hypothetical protein B296_00050500 [Ensete ventricosum]